MIYPKLTRLIEEQDVDSAKQIIDQVSHLIVLRCQKGYEDWDPNVRTNCGLLNDRVIKIDVGRFIRNEEMKTQPMCASELTRIMTPFQTWLASQNPALGAYYDEAIAKACP